MNHSLTHRLRSHHSGILSFKFHPKTLLNHHRYQNLHTLPLQNCGSMADSDESQPPTDSSQNGLTSLDNYPVPLSPPLPAISKQIELSRAMTASSKSSLFSLSTCHVIYEDQWLIAINKPQGIYCETILSSVPTLLKPPQGVHVSVPELHLANRLDRDTSGVTIITKSHKVASKFVKAFTDHEVRKTYIALCSGVAPKWNRITVRSGHGRSKFGAWRVYAASDVGRKLPGGSVVRDMETSFEVLSVNGSGTFRDESEINDGGDVVVVEERAVREGSGGDAESEIIVRAYPRSGRTHQIRLHCQYLGISIVGDVKYEGVCEWKEVAREGHALHAESLSFKHPITGDRISLHAPLPSWANKALQLQH
ncbi:hypothetical protein HN51_054713 [Arachis hypogaea]|uniref:RNA pseudouridine synthase 1 n=1 Tax=Arachis ipaensis TaxID=130454 RepID=UPI0007AFCB14|nr:RNA pseudouridine synthase 1 [Arachis ipaensis]XP_025676866.1 RNA pseudouridine synthase 1 [Arachis hypogaea]